VTGDLRSAALEAWHAVARLRELAGAGPGVLPTLGERIGALLDEFAWETGLIDPGGTDPDGARLDHVGIVVGDLAAAARLYGEVLGGRLVAGGRHAGMGVRTLHYRFAGGKVELLQPVAPGAIADFLAARGAGMHHLTFFVPSFDATTGELTSRGYRVVDPVDLPDWREAHVSPRSTQGCLIQVVTSPAGRTPEVDDVTVEQVLVGDWEWVEHRPRRVTGHREDGPCTTS
jgi:catechol 2,3-dioxygenase-like lactoylglutathione lyase family enzyme